MAEDMRSGMQAAEQSASEPGWLYGNIKEKGSEKSRGRQEKARSGLLKLDIAEKKKR